MTVLCRHTGDTRWTGMLRFAVRPLTPGGKAPIIH